MSDDKTDTVIDTSKFTVTPHFVRLQVSEWKCYLFGGGSTGIVFHPVHGNEPCWFWRKMQWFCFGNKWVKK
jgi:hypothetical protein